MSKKSKSKSKKWIIVVIVLAVIAAVFYGLFFRPETAIYKEVKAKTSDITTYYSFSGNIEANDRQSIMSGKVMHIYDIKVNEGDMVAEDDELIRTNAGERIKAGIDGEVISIEVEDNEQVMSGMKLVEIVNFDNLEISVKVDEYDLAAVEKGKETTVQIGAVNKEVKGKIGSVSKEGEITNGVTYFRAIINLDKDEELKPGMSAEVKILNNQATDVVTLPMYAIQFDDSNNPYVMIKDENDMIVNQDITTGINDGVTVEITSGISAGDIIFYTDNEPLSATGFGPMGRDS